LINFVTIENGDVYAFGNNINGMLGISSNLPFVLTPTKMSAFGPNNKLSTMAVGHNFAMAIDCKQLFIIINNIFPHRIDFMYFFLAIGRLWIWGSGNQIGDGQATNRNAPILHPILSSISFLRGGLCAGTAAFAYTADGELYSWGSGTIHNSPVCIFYTCY
jgi:alpha-tubulin suppressor-like RCC1 family protein